MAINNNLTPFSQNYRDTYLADPSETTKPKESSGKKPTWEILKEKFGPIFLQNLKTFGSLQGSPEDSIKDYDLRVKKENGEELTQEEQDFINSYDADKTMNSRLYNLYVSWIDDGNSAKGTVFGSSDDDDRDASERVADVFDEYLSYKAEDSGTTLDRMTDAEREKFTEDTLNPLIARARSESYFNNLLKGVSKKDQPKRLEEAKKYATYKAVMAGVNDYILGKRDEKKKAAEDEANYVTFTYEPGDTFGQKIIDLGLMSDKGLWGEDGDVAYYTRQLRDGDYLDNSGNIRIGDTIRLKRRQ